MSYLKIFSLAFVNRISGRQTFGELSSISDRVGYVLSGLVFVLIFTHLPFFLTTITDLFRNQNRGLYLRFEIFFSIFNQVYSRAYFII